MSLLVDGVVLSTSSAPNYVWYSLQYLNISGCLSVFRSIKSLCSTQIRLHICENCVHGHHNITTTCHVFILFNYQQHV